MSGVVLIPMSWIIASFFIGFLGQHRKMGFWGYFFASLLLSPLLGLLLVILSDRRKSNADSAEDEKT